MPILKVSDTLRVKQAMEVIRIQITVLGDCPQCQGGNYRSGVCEDCGFISPEVMQAIQEWQQSQGMGKAAARSLAFADYLPSGADISRDFECPKCGKKGFDLQCENPQCGYEEPPRELNHKRPQFTGIDPKLISNVERRFIPSADNTPAGKKIQDGKNHLKKHKKKKKQAAQGMPDLGNVQTILDDKTNRAHEMLGEAAQIEFQNKLTGQEQGSETDKE